MAVAANNTEQAAGPEPETSAAANVAAVIKLDPRLFMAARRGDCKRLKDLLKLEDGDSNDEQDTATAEAAAQVVVEVDRQRRPAAAPASGLLDLVTIEGDSLLHVVAACGDGEEFLDCAKVLFSHDKDLLAARNNKGDTPLHCAAIAGNEKMVTCLVLLATDGEREMKELLRIRNKCGETALHYAVRARCKDIVDKLMSKDPDLACNDTTPNEASPLYLAISLGEMGIARRLFDTTRTKGKPSTYSGPDGRNVLHAAVVSGGTALQELLKWLKDVTAVDEDLQEEEEECLLSQLTRKRDENGSTPLHLAASRDGLPYSEFISEVTSWKMPSEDTHILLDAEMCPVYQPDKQGLYPIHIAAWGGSIDVVKLLLKRCPDSATLRDSEGGTFLHVAVERKKKSIVHRACWGRFYLPSILNLQDNSGDTALHRAVRVGDLDIFTLLAQNNHVCLDVANKEGLTPRDLWWTTAPNTFHHLWNPRNAILNSLIVLRARHGETRSDILYKKHFPKRDYDKESEKLTSTAQSMSLISVLVATVTFASAFTLPGGYQQSGAPVLAGSYAFNAFILADTLAFIFSCLANTLMAFGVGQDLAVRYRTSGLSYKLLQISVRCLLASFALGLYVVLAPVARGTAILVCVIVISFSFPWDAESIYVLRMTFMTVNRFSADWKRSRLVYSFMLLRQLLLEQVGPYIVIFGLPTILNLKGMTRH